MNLPLTVYPRSIKSAARTLDRVDPEWYTRIDLDTLRMTKSDTCVLGQLYIDYYYGFKKLFGEGRDIDEYSSDAVFGIRADEAIWKAEVKYRLDKETDDDVPSVANLFTQHERTQLIALILGQQAKLTDKQKLDLVVKLGNFS